MLIQKFCRLDSLYSDNIIMDILFHNLNTLTYVWVVVSACRCNLKGSTNISCEDHTGQCHCKPGYAGQNCGECPNGFYGFPDCQPCDCRGYSEVCDRESGVCIDCSGGRSGDHCEVWEIL